MEIIADNESIIYSSRIFVSLIFGIASGILGFTGLLGFFICFLGLILTSCFVYLTLPERNISKYLQSPSNLLFTGLFQGIMTFILFWTIAYDMVYIFIFNKSQKFKEYSKIPKSFCKINPENFKSKSTKLSWEKPPQNILLVAKPHIDSEKAVAKIGKYLNEKYDVNLILEQPSSIINRLEDTPYYIISAKEDFNKIDLIIAAGGDGTVLYLNSLFQQNPLPPLLCFSKGGSLGFLLPHDLAEYKESIFKVMENKSNITNRMRLSCQVLHHKDNQVVNNFIVANEMVLHRGETQVPISIKIKLNGKKLTVLRGDGIIIATSTGSTGYSLSAGGSMVHPEIDSILITPICPRSLSFRPLVLPPSAEVELEIPHSSFPIVSSFDGVKYVRILGGDKITVQKCSTPLPSINREDSVKDWLKDVNERLKFNLQL
eukprot:gene826-9076_t